MAESIYKVVSKVQRTAGTVPSALAQGAGGVVLWVVVVGLVTVGLLGGPTRDVLLLRSGATTLPGSAAGAALGWLVIVVLFHLWRHRVATSRVLAAKDDSVEREAHFREARETLRVWGHRLGAELPSGAAIDDVIVEAERTAGAAAAPATALALTALAVGALPLMTLAGAEGWVGAGLLKVSLLAALLAVQAQPVAAWSGLVVIVAVPVMWFLLPWLALGREAPWSVVDGIVFLPVFLLFVRYLGRIRRAGATRLLLLTAEGLFMGVPRMKGTVAVSPVSASGAVTGTEEPDGFDLRIPVSDGKPQAFFVRSRAEMEQLESSGQVAFRGVRGRVRLGAGGTWLVVAFALAVVAVTLAVPVAGLGVHDGAVLQAAVRLVDAAGTLAVAAPPPATVVLGLGQAMRARLAARERRWDDALAAVESARRLARDCGVAGRLVKELDLSGFVAACVRIRLAEKEAAELPGTEGRPAAAVRAFERARRVGEVVADLAPRIPRVDVLYDLVIQSALEARLEAGSPWPEADFLLARALGLQLGRQRMGVDSVPRDTRTAWARDAEKLLTEARGKVDETAWLRAHARLMFEGERFEEAIEDLKKLGEPEDRLMMASAARFTSSSLAYHLRRIRDVGSSMASLVKEARLLEALIVAQTDGGKGAKAILTGMARDDEPGFQARFVQILVLDQAGLPTPTTEVLEAKMPQIVPGLSRVTDLRWPPWMAGADVEYLIGIRGEGDRAVLARLAGLTWYPGAKRAAKRVAAMDTAAEAGKTGVVNTP